MTAYNWRASSVLWLRSRDAARFVPIKCVLRIAYCATTWAPVKLTTVFWAQRPPSMWEKNEKFLGALFRAARNSFVCTTDGSSCSAETLTRRFKLSKGFDFMAIHSSGNNPHCLFELKN